MRRQLAEMEAKLDADTDADAEDNPLRDFAGRPDARQLWEGSFSLDRKRRITRKLLDVAVYRPEVHPNQHHPIDPEECVWIDWRIPAGAQDSPARG